MNTIALIYGYMFMVGGGALILIYLLVLMIHQALRYSGYLMKFIEWCMERNRGKGP